VLDYESLIDDFLAEISPDDLHPDYLVVRIPSASGGYRELRGAKATAYMNGLDCDYRNIGIDVSKLRTDWFEQYHMVKREVVKRLAGEGWA
jgi:hypothetical protein